MDHIRPSMESYKDSCDELWDKINEVETERDTLFVGVRPECCGCCFKTQTQLTRPILYATECTFDIDTHEFKPERTLVLICQLCKSSIMIMRQSVTARNIQFVTIGMTSKHNPQHNAVISFTHLTNNTQNMHLPWDILMVYSHNEYYGM